MKARVCSVGAIQYKGKFLICKMPGNKGVYPGQWAIPGGGIEDNETMGEGLIREIREEVGLELVSFEPLQFSDERKEKLVGDGTAKDLYMIFLVFVCEAKNDKVKLCEEFEEYAWVGLDEVLAYNLNEPTRKTFGLLGAKMGKVPEFVHREWSRFPQGKIPKGSACYWCGRYNARDSVVNVMVWKENKVLLVKRDIEPGKGMWALPGGYIDWDETLEEAAIREVWEECEVKLDAVTLVKIYSLPKMKGKDDGRQNVVHMFVAEYGGEAMAGDETSEVGWFGPDELPKMAFGHDEVVREFKRTMNNEQ